MFKILIYKNSKRYCLEHLNLENLDLFRFSNFVLRIYIIVLRISLSKGRHYEVLPSLSAGYSPLRGTFLCITHPSATAPTYVETVPLACLRHTASVHPEPGSNSQKKLTSLHILIAKSKYKIIFKF